DSSEEEDPVVPNLTPLESLARQVKCLLKYSTTWKHLNPNSWLYHAKLLDASTPVRILQEIVLRLSHCSHCVPKLEPIPEWPPLASFKETTRTEPNSTTYSYADFQKAV
ncbi:hypothetical protein EI555_000959, partial [Monodon monoceros]